MLNNQKARPETQANGEQDGCFSAAKDAVIQPGNQVDGPGGRCFSIAEEAQLGPRNQHFKALAAEAQGKNHGCYSSVDRDTGIQVDNEGDSCCHPANKREAMQPDAQLDTQNNGNCFFESVDVTIASETEDKSERNHCCSPLLSSRDHCHSQAKEFECCPSTNKDGVTRTEAHFKNQSNECHSSMNKIDKVQLVDQIDNGSVGCCSSKLKPAVGTSKHNHGDCNNEGKEQGASSSPTNEMTPPCCEGIGKNCCDDTCMDELAIRECSNKCTDVSTPEKSTVISTAASTGNGFSRRSRKACSNHIKMIRLRWAAKLESVGCICRSLLAMNQQSCCTSDKRRSTRDTRLSGEYSMRAASQKHSCGNYNTSMSQGRDRSVIEETTGADEQICCVAKTNIVPGSDGVDLDESLISPSTCAQVCKATCCADNNIGSCDKPPEEVDVEKGFSDTEHVMLSVSGMTCTGCETKLKRTLERLPSVAGLKTSLVLARAEFDINPAVISVTDAMRHLQRTTGFKCDRITSEGSELHVVPSIDVATFLQQDWPAGVTNTEKVGDTIRICFDARVVGARQLLRSLQHPAQLAPRTGLALGGGHVRYVGLMTLLSAVLTIPVLVLAWAPFPKRPVAYGSVSLALATIVQVAIAGPFYPDALKALLFSRVVEMDLLIVLSTSAAYMFSVISFAYIILGDPLSTGEFFETSTLLVTLIMVGRFIAALARQKAVESVTVRSFQDTMAVLIAAEDASMETEIDVRLLQYGDIFRVMPDSRIVTDGTIVSGSSEVSEAMVTGESSPVEKHTGSFVIAGSVNGFGVLDVRVTRLPDDNTISAIANMVDEAKLSKPKLQNIADRVASYFVPVIIALALITFVVWIGIGVRKRSASDAVVSAIAYAITVLIVSCPCAIGLAVPMVIVVANGVAAKHGVVFKSAQVVEIGWKVTHVVFDKTGTLTTGELAIMAEEQLLGTPEIVRAQLLGLVNNIKHPVAAAIASHLNAQDVTPVQIKDVCSMAGKGIEGTVNGIAIRAGNSRWLGARSHFKVQQLLAQGHTVFCVEIGGKLAAIYGLQDQIRPESASIVDTLQKRSVVVSIISGDDEGVVAATATSLGISDFRAQYSPADKRDYLQTLSSTSRNGSKKPVTLFVGDGANDGPALAQADIGVHIAPTSSFSPESASSAARAAADAVLLRPSLQGLLILTAISRAAFRRIIFNFVWSFAYNLFAVLLAAGAFATVRIPPEYAGLGELVSVLPVVLAAILLRWTTFDV